MNHLPNKKTEAFEIIANAPNKQLNAAAYCRVSTDHTDQLHSLSAQIKYFTDFIGEQSQYRLKEVYYDEGITGTSVKKRDSFNRMISDAENGLIDVILTKEVSRFARNTVDTLSFTRKLSAIGVRVIFTNDGIDTFDKDGELRLTIMASIAQEESRKTSERVKWSLFRKMENGFVFGNKQMLGFRIENGAITIEPQEAEIVRRIFNDYAYSKKGANAIAKELNADGIFTIRGNSWTGGSVLQTLKNEKYVGDLVQARYCTTDFLTKTRSKNTDVPLISITDHHEGIIDRELWDIVQKNISDRGLLTAEGRKHSGTYWYSGKIRCGLCNYTYSASLTQKKEYHTLFCRNRRTHGTKTYLSSNGNSYGCSNTAVNEKVLMLGMEYILKHIQSARDEIVGDLLSEIKSMQQKVLSVDVKPLEDEIENFNAKKRKAIDLMIEEL